MLARASRWWLLLFCALASGLCLALYPFAPVVEHTATYHWAANVPRQALPLNPYRPVGLDLRADCADLTRAPGAALDTVQAVDPGLRAQRLTLAAHHGRLSIDSAAKHVGEVELGGCREVVLTIDSRNLVVSLDGREALRGHGDLRPTVDGFFVPPGLTGMRADVVADTSFDTSPSLAKLVLGGLGLALLLTALALLRGVAGRRPLGGPQRGQRREARCRRLGPADAVVALALVTGNLIGGVTDDDGFIAQIIRTPGPSGYVGNYVRWNNAPEAPFGWFYQPYAWWGSISMEPVWLRVPPLLIGWCCWWVLWHGILPRAATRLSILARLGAASSFVLLWLVFGNSLRPENLFALGLGLSILAVDTAVRRRQPSWLVVAAVIAGWCTAVGPTGVTAVAPLVVVAPALWRWLRPRGGGPVGTLRMVTLAILVLVGFGSAVLVMFADQSFAAVAMATHARTAYGPIFPFWMDPRRYWMLFMSYATRQISVYVPAAALAYLGWRWRPRRWGGGADRLPGVRTAIVRQVLGGGIGLIVAMIFSPTKLPHHFGALIVIGPVAVALALELWGRARASIANAFLAGGVVVLCGLAMLRNNVWWKLSSVGLQVDQKPLRLGPLDLAYPVLAFGVVLGLWGWRRMRRHGDLPQRRRWPVWLAGALTLFTVLQYANFAQAIALRGQRYTIGMASASAIAGRPCLLERRLYVETEPSAGALAPESGFDGSSFDHPEPTLDGLRVWQADPQRAQEWTTPWYRLPESVRQGQWPVVVAISGLDASHRVRIDYDHGAGKQLRSTRKTYGHSTFADVRVQPWVDAPKATRFRLTITSEGAGDTAGSNDSRRDPARFAVARPRVPVATPLSELARAHQVAVAWNLAFFAPCLAQPPISQGRVAISEYMLSDSEQPGNMSYHSRSGGPFAGVLGLTEPYRVPLYARDDYTESTISALDLVRFVPAFDTQVAAAERHDVVRDGWQPVPSIP